MEIEQLEIHDFLLLCHPLNQLSSDELKELAENIEITYFSRNQTVLEPGQHNEWLYLIRSGAVTRTDHNDGLVAQFGQKDFFGHRAIERGGIIKNRVSTIEDSLFYLIPKARYRKLMENNQAFNQYFSQQKHERLKSALQLLRSPPENSLIKSKAADFMHQEVLTLQQQDSIADAALQMKNSHQTAALVIDETGIKGIVTDRLFCTKVVAMGLDTQQPIASVMTPEPISIDRRHSGLEAMLLMTRMNIRHLPVVEDGQLLGMVTATDLMHHQSHNPIYLVNQIHKSQSLSQLPQLSQQLPVVLTKQVDAGLNASDIAYSISSIGRAFASKVIELCVRELGPAPVPFAYMVAGSLARNDQTAHSDQDNGLLLSDQFDASLHGEYFAQLSEQVSEHLNRCGYVFCPGDVMASNPKWRQPLAQWQHYFDGWINSPEPKALMYSSIFFDLRCVYGDQSLFDQLQQHIRELTRNNRLFLAFMAANAQQNKPPLGLFRRFVLEQHGAEHKTLDIKKRGIMPCTDIARVFALDAGTEVINTLERIKRASESGVISNEAAVDLRDSFELLSLIRLQHQVRNIKRGQEANNYINPDELSSLERRHLKDAFELIRTYQDVVTQKYNQGQLG
ncbi:putative nucleotidyltransferase substrate binding domain-containing protein [Marinicella sediminis]|uniref:Nucleotidyltransferase substrate binding domain-containing protein n=1 Tax=Marinicella sediminis TaxID=1792834 RepID=A0ABV7J6L9_9GAMM|nr:putative nucleotidyltransferase substrate binding domain-containing protein [Marinicella sediminis]